MSAIDLLTGRQLARAANVLGVDPATLASPFDQPAAAEAKLDRCLALLASDDATLADVRTVLHVLGRSVTPVDPVRLMGICMRLSGALGRFGEHVLDAPPSAVADLVEGCCLVACRNEACGAKVAPWHGDFNGCCDGTCEAAWLRTVES